MTCFKFPRLTGTIGELPAPWAHKGYLRVGGLTDVGFGHSSELLLVVTHSGKSVLDCTTSCFVVRDRNPEFCFDIGNLETDGIGPLEGQKIRTSGLFGGGLAKTTFDGWSIDWNPASSPQNDLLLTPPMPSDNRQKHGNTIKSVKLGNFLTEVRAFGFSPTGMILLIATSSDITIYRR